MGEAYAREDPVGEEKVRARFLSASWGADHPPANFLSTHGSRSQA